MKKSTITIISTLMCMLLLTGCGVSTLDLSEENEKIITEYAVGLLLKYDVNHHNRLVDTSVVPQVEVAPLPVETVAPPDVNSENLADDATEPVAEKVYLDIAQAIDLEGVSIQYKNYGYYDSYPVAEESDASFSLIATENNKLLVIFFDLTNTTQETKDIDLISKNIQYKIKVNNNTNKTALTTMLMDDMGTFKDAIEPGSTAQVVLVIEVKAEEAVNVEELQLTIISGDTTTTTWLF